MIDEIDILHKCHCCDFTCHTGENAAGLLCIVPYHHKIIVKLRKYSFNSFAESPVSPRRWSPVLLIQSVWNLKGDVCGFKEILLNRGAEITFVSKHHAVMILPTYILKIMKVMDACSRHVIGMYDATYPTDNMELIPIVVYALRCAISPVGSRIDIVTPHGATFRPGVLADLYRLGINAEDILGPIYRGSHILPDFFCKPGRQLTAGVELSSANQVWQIFLALIVQAMKKEILAVENECLGCYAQSHDFEVGKFRHNATSGDISKFIYTIPGEILADSEDSDEICYEVAHMQCYST